MKRSHPFAGPICGLIPRFDAAIGLDVDSEEVSRCQLGLELKTLEDKPPVSEEALHRRADRDLSRLADAADEPSGTVPGKVNWTVPARGRN